MADPSPTQPLQNDDLKPGHKVESNAGMTPDQIRAIADRVYGMLLRDLKQERERDRSSSWSSGTFKRG